jgi:hypothetical protein
MKKVVVVSFVAGLIISFPLLPAFGRVLDEGFGNGRVYDRSLPAHIQFDSKVWGEIGGRASAGDTVSDTEGSGQGSTKRTAC